MLEKNIGNNRTIQGSVLSATKRLINSVFHEGWRIGATLVPSVRIILYGSARNRGKTTPVNERTRNTICRNVSQKNKI